MLPAGMLSFPQQAEAGPLLDWMLGRNRYRNTVPYGSNYNAAAIAASANGQLQPGVCQVNCQRTCQRTVVNYVPQTCYRTRWQQVPVTSYRPVTNTDPCSGCTVTCMRPCTSYTWQAQRVPYTTYRPVYRTETYRVPVTYYTTDCANPTSGCASCTNTGGASGVFQPGGITPQPTPANPSTSLNTYGQSVLGGNAADIAPSINSPTSSQRPVYPSYPSPSSLQSFPQLQTAPLQTGSGSTPGSSINWQEEPTLIPADKQADATVRQRWSYQPVRLASHEEVVEPVAARREVRAEVQMVPMNAVLQADLPAMPNPPASSNPPSRSSTANPNAHWQSQ